MRYKYLKNIESYQQERDNTPLFGDQHIESPTGSSGIHDLETYSRAEKLRSKLRRRKHLPFARAQQDQLRIERQDAPSLYAENAIQVMNVRMVDHIGCADDNGAGIHRIVDAQASLRIGADQVDV
jgi:hypothetical protein